VLASRYVVVAAGAWSAHVDGLPAEVVPPVRPVKGQTLRLRLPGRPRLNGVVRGLVKGSPVYLVPRADGRIVVGASSEEHGFDIAPRAGAVYELLRDAQSLMPEIGEAVLEEVSTGLRPGSPDNAPIIGPTAVDGLVLATGHYRNGILLTPITADAVAELLSAGALPADVRPFAPSRFQAVPT
jgi:glycine oxidase